MVLELSGDGATIQQALASIFQAQAPPTPASLPPAGEDRPRAVLPSDSPAMEAPPRSGPYRGIRETVAATAAPADPAPDRVHRPRPARGLRRGKTASTLYECSEYPGQPLSKEEVADIAKKLPASVYAAVKYAEKHGKPWARVNGFEFRRFTPDAQAAIPEPDIGEAHPRHSRSESQPINPRINGAAATITHSDPG